MPPDNDHKFENFVQMVERSLNTLNASRHCLKAAELKLYNLCFNDYYKELFYNELKIVGGAFSVLEAVSRQALLLFSRKYNRSPDVQDSDFFWFSYEAEYYKQEDAVVIDRLFLTTRESQKFDINAPDFLRFINQPQYELSCFTNNVTKHYSLPVLFCDNSEIVIFLLCYLELLERSKIICDAHTWPTNSPEAISVLDPEAISVLDGDASPVDTVRDIYNDYLGQEKSILLSHKLYFDLGLGPVQK